ncbi:hypothetical protein XENOCAPTIV_017666 [Xenoophorus captivus]|uniref:Uncharacterized protein n=1 Tax=Xenoophorus captivus TaxID=1517983 RepID=A0ABV0QTD0_9TELE
MDVKGSKKAKKATGSSRTRNRLRNCERGEKMAQRRISGDRLFITVVYLVAMCRAVPIGDLLDRASQRSDKMHSLSTLLTQEMVRSYCSCLNPVGSLVWLFSQDDLMLARTFRG